MRKLALSDEILMSIEKPARYIGGEYNSVMKDKEQVDVRFCMCFPDVYEIGMSHLGIQILYDMFNRREDTWCERVYSPWPDLHKVMKEQHIPLFALESQDPLKEFDFLGITLQYEMCYTNILQVLDLAEIPIWSKDRKKGDPIVIAGGPCSYNPEPIADFFDIFYIGEGETVYGDLIELYKIYKHSDMTREEFLIKVSQIPGLYVPALYDVTYHEDGTIASFGPKYEGVPKTILKQVVTDMSSAVYPEKPVVSYMKVTQDRVVLEIMRGCIRGCRFCQAGMIYRVLRKTYALGFRSAIVPALSSRSSDALRSSPSTRSHPDPGMRFHSSRRFRTFQADFQDVLHLLSHFLYMEVPDRRYLLLRFRPVFLRFRSLPADTRPEDLHRALSNSM